VKRIAAGHWAVGTATSEYLSDVAEAARASTGPVELGRAQTNSRMASRVGLRTPKNACSLIKKAVVDAEHVLVTFYDPVRRVLNSCYPVPVTQAWYANWKPRRTIP
jgi:hypothetical protein